MRYFVLIGMIMLLIGGCEFVQGEQTPVVKIDSDEMLDELTRTNTSSNIVKWEVDFKDKYVDLSYLGAFLVKEVNSGMVSLEIAKEESWEMDVERRKLPDDYRPLLSFTIDSHSNIVPLSGSWEPHTYHYSDWIFHKADCGFLDKDKPTVATFKRGQKYLIKGVISSPPKRTIHVVNLGNMMVELTSSIPIDMTKFPHPYNKYEHRIPPNARSHTKSDITEFVLSDCEFTPAPE